VGVLRGKKDWGKTIPQRKNGEKGGLLPRSQRAEREKTNRKRRRKVNG